MCLPAELARQVARTADLYLLCHVSDDVGEAVVRGALEHAGLLGSQPGQVPPHRYSIPGCSCVDARKGSLCAAASAAAAGAGCMHRSRHDLRIAVLSRPRPLLPPAQPPLSFPP